MFAPEIDGWNTSLSYWGPAYFQGRLLLVSGRVNFQPHHLHQPTNDTKHALHLASQHGHVARIPRPSAPRYVKRIVKTRLERGNKL